MGLWSPLNRAMVIAAGAGVLAACYAVAAWGQAGEKQMLPGGALSGQPTVSVTALLIPESAWRHFERARSAARAHRDAEFERESARAIAIAPRFASMYLLRATVDIGACRFEDAVASAKAAAAADPEAMWTAVVLAGAYNGMHRFQDALLVLDRKRGIEAESWQAMYERARAETGLGHAGAAMLWSGRALRDAPREFIDVHLVRSNALLLEGRLGEAAAQMVFYLQSKGPQAHHAEVVALLKAVRAQMDTASLAKGALATDGPQSARQAAPGTAAR